MQVLERQWLRLIGTGLALALVSSVDWLQNLLEAVASLELLLFVVGLILSFVWWFTSRGERKRLESK